MKRGAVALLFHLGLQNRSKDEWQKGVSGKRLRAREEKAERNKETVLLHSSLAKAHSTSPAFTIVELLIVIVIIAILAAITIISYNGITNRTKESSLKTELSPPP